MTRTPNTVLATIFGILYVIFGFCGAFAVGGVVGFFDSKGALLFGLWEVNIFHNSVHVLIGIALLIVAASSAAASKSLNIGIGIVLLVLGVLGFFLENTSANFFAFNLADNILHLASGAILLLAGLAADRRRAPLTA